MADGKRYLLGKGEKKRYALSDMKYDEVSFVTHGANADAHVVLWKSASQGYRDDAKEKGCTFPDGSYPIMDQEHLDSAWKLRRHSKSHSEGDVVAHIKRAAKKLGLKLPEELSKTGPLPEDVHVDSPDWGIGIPKKKRKLMTGGRGNTATTRNVQCPVCAHKMSVSKSAECTCGVVIKNEGPGQPLDVVETGILSAVLKLGNDIVGVVSVEDSTKADVVKVIQGFADDVAGQVDGWLEFGTELHYATGLDEDVEKLFSDAYEVIAGIVHSTEEVEPVNKRRAKAVSDRVDSDDPVELAKSLPADSPIRKALEDVAGLRDEVSKMREKEATEAWVVLAKSLQYVPGKPEEIGAELRKIEKALGADDAKKHLARLEAMNKVAKDSDLFKARGSNSHGVPADSAMGEVETRKAALKKSMGADLDDVVLMEAVFRDNPSLYERYIEEQG